MPFLPAPAYRPLFPFRNSHVHTIYPTLFRPVPDVFPKRERIGTPDGDFLDIDWHLSGLNKKTDTAAIISHGLEGNSRKKYPLGMARQMNALNFDAVCLNFRGCSGTPNLLPRMYHSGITDDLHTVICHVLKQGYQRIFLIGFSVGGNQILKYLGEDPDYVPREVLASVVFSVPCDLGGAVERLDTTKNRFYLPYFMRGLRNKVRIKAGMFPGFLDIQGLDKINTFHAFDDRYTAPMHGFKDAEDYYRRASSRQFLHDIRVASLVVQAADDPFLSSSCYPEKEAEKSDKLFLQIPEYGGHAGFYMSGKQNVYWSEMRAGTFLQHYSG
ncbi:MAG: YheT family hydrolase [Thermodesulfobacteriota bacterium]